MNRTGLLIALAIAAFVGLVFGLYPELDLKIAALFFDPASKRFVQNAYPWLGPIREAAMWLVTAFATPPVVAILLKVARPRAPMFMPGRAVLFLLATLALGPGLIVNAVLKEEWGRSRPIDVPQLGGAESFTPWWDPRGVCEKNCSFVSGDGAAAFWTVAPAVLAPPAWRPVAVGAALAFGAGVSVLRMAFGGHFLTDVVFAGVFMFLTIWLAHGLIYRWPRTRLTDETIERWQERTILPVHRAVAAMLGRRGG